jgi:neutral trehalase
MDRNIIKSPKNLNLMKIRLFLFTLFIYNSLITTGQNPAEHQNIQNFLQQGWQTSNTSNILSFTLHPQLLELSFELKFQHRYYYGQINRERDFWGETEYNKPKFHPVAHSLNNDYIHLSIDWNEISISIEAAQFNDEFFVLITTHQQPKFPTVIATKLGFLYNATGYVIKNGNHLSAITGTDTISIYTNSSETIDNNLILNTPYFIFPVDLSEAQITLSNQKNFSKQTIIDKVEEKRKLFYRKAASFGKDSLSYQALSSIMGWNTIYEHSQQRIFSTVSRDWNVRRGGYAMFCWDNFFMGYMSALENKELAFANILELLKMVTPDGFVPNNAQGNGAYTVDRSQPPVGSLMVKEIYKKFPEKWFLEAVFDDLYRWNDWWMEHRLYKGLLCWGSSPNGNVYNDPVYHNRVAASYESGLDDSPMYVGIEFDTINNVLLLHDVGLNSLYIADCNALSEIAMLLGKKKEVAILTERASKLTHKMETLWNEEVGIYQNRNLTTNTFSDVLTPTLFYPLIAKIPSQDRAAEMIYENLMDSTKFWGDWVLPSVAKNNSNFSRQRYWNGAIWAPLNFLVYLGLRNYDFPEVQKQMVEKSRLMFENGWIENYYVGENYSAFDGTVTNPALKSDPFYTWGALLGMIGIIEEGFMPATETPIK